MTKKTLAIDTETTGVDLYHSAAPYFVSMCEEGQDPVYYEWPVDPLTREVIPDPDDLAEIRSMLEGADVVVGHNIKFDVTAMKVVLPDYEWPWHKTVDTLMASHLLTSMLRHNLTDVTMRWLRVDIEPLEKNLKAACMKARDFCRRYLPHWRIAREGEDDMPSVKGSAKARDKGGADERPWKCDAWLPRLLRHVASSGEKVLNDEGEAVDLSDFACQEYLWWETVARDYAVADSAATVAVWPVMCEEIVRRGYWDNFMERMELPRLAYLLERRGITVKASEYCTLKAKYEAQSQACHAECMAVAQGLDYPLVMPKGGRNQSLDAFVFGEPYLNLPPLKWTAPKQGDPKPTFDKDDLAHYAVTLPEGSPGHRFCKALASKRKKDKALESLETYRRFALPYGDPRSDEDGEYWILHPSINPAFTGTTRWSSTNPSEQTISKQADAEGYSLRDIFCPPPGYELWSMDAKNIELRIPFYVSGEEALIDLFERPDDPPYFGSNHLANFHAVYPEIWEAEYESLLKDKNHIKKKFADSWYQWCKNGGFCKQYGGGRAKTDATFRRQGAYDLLNSKFAKLNRLNEQKIKEAERYGYVETMKCMGRKRGYPLMCTRTENDRVLSTVPLSYFVQGTAMEWTNRGMIRADVQLRQWQTRGFDAYMYIQCHDEIVFAMPAGGDPRADLQKEKSRKGRPYFRTSNLWRARILQGLLEEGGKDIGLPTPVGVEYHGSSWGKGVTVA